MSIFQKVSGSIFGSPFGSPFGRDESGIPRQNLLAYFRSTDTIDLSTSDYDKIGSIWKSTFFTDATTPNTVAIADIRASVHFNKANVIGNDDWIAIYDASADLATTERARQKAKVTLDWCTDVPQSQANALVRLYNMWNGEGWTTKTNWLSYGLVGDWHGITVAGGNVTIIELLNGATLVGDISAVTPLVSLEKVELASTSVTGDIACLSHLINCAFFGFYNTDISGDISVFASLPQAVSVYISLTEVEGDIAAFSTCVDMTTLYIEQVPLVYGDVSVFSTHTSMALLLFGSTGISGDIGSLAPLELLSTMYASSTAVAYTSTTLPQWNNTAIRVNQNAWDQTQVDNFLCDWASAGGSGGSLNISGTNAAPSATGTACKDTLFTQGRTVTVST